MPSLQAYHGHAHLSLSRRKRATAANILKVHQAVELGIQRLQPPVAALTHKAQDTDPRGGQRRGAKRLRPAQHDRVARDGVDARDDERNRGLRRLVALKGGLAGERDGPERRARQRVDAVARVGEARAGEVALAQRRRVVADELGVVGDEGRDGGCVGFERAAGLGVAAAGGEGGAERGGGEEREGEEVLHGGGGITIIGQVVCGDGQR